MAKEASLVPKRVEASFGTKPEQTWSLSREKYLGFYVDTH